MRRTFGADLHEAGHAVGAAVDGRLTERVLRVGPPGMGVGEEAAVARHHPVRGILGVHREVLQDLQPRDLQRGALHQQALDQGRWHKQGKKVKKNKKCKNEGGTELCDGRV